MGPLPLGHPASPAVRRPHSKPEPAPSPHRWCADHPPSQSPSPRLTGGAQTTLHARARPLASSKWMACEAASWASSARICKQERRGGEQGVCVWRRTRGDGGGQQLYHPRKLSADSPIPLSPSSPVKVTSLPPGPAEPWARGALRCSPSGDRPSDCPQWGCVPAAPRGRRGR